MTNVCYRIQSAKNRVVAAAPGYISTTSEDVKNHGAYTLHTVISQLGTGGKCTRSMRRTLSCLVTGNQRKK